MTRWHFTQKGNHREDFGFTLVELLVSMTLGSVIIASVYAIFLSQRSYLLQQQIRSEFLQVTRVAFDHMAWEVRMAGYDPTGADVIGLPYNAGQLEIRADLDSNGNTTGPNENITYTFDAPNMQILRNAGAGNEVFLDNIEAFSFEFFDEDGVATTVDEDIRQVSLEIRIRASKADPDYPLNNGFRTFTAFSFVTPRKLS